MFAQQDTLETDTTLSFPFSNSQSGGLFLNTPKNINSTIEYDLNNEITFCEAYYVNSPDALMKMQLY